MKKLLICLLIIPFLFSAAIITATGKQEGAEVKKEDVVLNYFSYHNVGDIEEVIMQDYAKETGIRAEMMSVPAASYHDKLAPSLFSGQATFDMFWSWQGWTEEFYPYLEDITNDLPEDLKKDILPAAAIAVTYKGKWYGVPQFLALPVMYYNKNYFSDAGLDPEKPPVNHDELWVTAKKTTLDKNGDGLPEVYGWGNAGIVFGLMARALETIHRVGGTWLEEKDGKMVPAFNNKYGQRMLDVYYNLFMADWVDPSCITTDEPELRKAFAAGKFAMLLMAGGAVEPFIRKEYPELIGNYGWAPMPGDKGCKDALPGARRSGSVIGSMGPVMVKDSPNRKYALEYFKTLISVEGQKRCLDGYGFSPARKSMAEDPEILEKYPYIPAVFEAAQYIAPRYPDKYYSAMQAECAPILEAFLLGKKNKQTTLNELEETITRIRSK